MAFGAPFDDFTGCVYVFVRDGAGWTQQGPKLFSPDAAGPMAFTGASLALSADGNTMVVGASGDNNAFGATFVYTRADGVWTQQGGQLIGSDAVGTQVHQSWGVAISADASTIAVGAPFDDNLAGATYIFTKVGSVWTQQGGKLVGTGAGLGQGFAVSLSADGSVCGVGDYGDADGVTAAWVFARAADGSWSQQAGPLVVPTTGAIADYAKGAAVSLTGDGKTLGVACAGVTVVIEERNGTWAQQGPPLIGSGAASVPVGQSAVVLTADGSRMLLGGTALDSATGQRFWTFARSPDGGWVEQSAPFIASNPGWNATYERYTSAWLSADASEIVIGRPQALNNSGMTWTFGFTGVPGGACSSDSDCLSNSCMAGVCQCNLFCSSYVCPGDCPGGTVCTTQSDGSARCATRNAAGGLPGQKCADGSQCLSGGCFNGKCGCNSFCALTPTNCPGGCGPDSLCIASPLGGGVCTGSGSDGLSAGAIAGIAIAGAVAAVVIFAAVLLAVLRCRRRRGQPQHKVRKDAALEPHEVVVASNPWPIQTSVSTGNRTRTLPGSVTLTSVAVPDSGSVTQRTCGEAKDEQLSLLLSQIRHLRKANEFLMHRFELLGPEEYCIGGQGLVQFATDAFDPNKQFAIKFFLNAQAFATERAHYANKDLQHILAPVHDVIGNESGELQVLGMPLPPMVVMERGEPLSEWTKRLQPNPALSFANSTTIVSHLVQRVGELHAAGLAHRDLKPQNVILLPSRNEWTVIDYGCGAALGSMAPLTYSLAYAAPETLLAIVDGHTEVVADAAVDVWALGVIAYELMTHKNVWADGQRDVILETMAGRRPLPWEDKGSDTHAADIAKLGFMKEMVLRMLARDPRERASLAEVNAAWSRLLQCESGGASYGSNIMRSASTHSGDAE